MILYHGSNMGVDSPRILTSNRSLDFDMGFYTTSSYEQAQRWARLQTARRRNSHPIVSVFDFDNTALGALSVLRFESATAQWLDFASENRKGLYQGELYDLVVGPSPTTEPCASSATT